MTAELEPSSEKGPSSSVQSMAVARRGRFYVFEGIDGSGKTTVSRRLFERISKESHREVLLTVEPTDCWLGDVVRKSFDEDVDPLTEALLFMADRAHHTRRIREWVSEGIVVLCDRYYPSTLAYQGAVLRRTMGDEAMDWLRTVSRPIIIEPDIIFLFSISPERVVDRLNGRDETSKFERLGYLRDVDAIYSKLAEEDPRFFVVDAAAPIEEVVDEVARAIKTDLM